MQKIHNFAHSLKVGEKGEALILDYLEQSPAIHKILDVRDSKLYQEKDIDFILKIKNGQECKIEVKTDTYTSGNIYYETMSAEETGSTGCLDKTEADYLFYFFINLGTLYILDMNQYRDWFQIHKPMFDDAGYQKKPKNLRWNGSTYTSVGYAFPVTLLEDETLRWVRKVYMT